MAETRAEWARRREPAAPAAGLRALRWTALRLPERASAALVWAITLGFAAWPGRAENRASRAYLQRLHGRPARFSEVHGQAYRFGLVMRDRVRFLAGGTAGFRIKAEGEAAVAEALAAGRGAVLLGAHLGSFEALRAFDRTLPGLRLRYMMHGEAARGTTEAYAALNPEVEARVISLSDGPGAMVAAQEALSAGEFVAFLGDRAPYAGERGLIPVPFLGKPMPVPASPYLTAMAAGVPLILCFAPLIGRDRYALQFQRIYDGAPVARSDRAAEAERLARLYAAALEEICRRHPDNWFNFHDVWRG